MNKADGKPLNDAAGKEVSASETFVPKKKNGTVELTFRFDSSLLAGTTVVAFEELYHNDIQVAVHTDIKDEDQSVHYPKVSTNAYDDMTESHLGTHTEEARIIDIVHYENLLTGKEYTVKGTLMDKATGEVLKDASGKAVKAEAVASESFSSLSGKRSATGFSVLFSGSPARKEASAVTAFPEASFRASPVALSMSVPFTVYCLPVSRFS